MALNGGGDDYLLLSGIQHFVFCRRQWGLIHIEQQWVENYLTTEGQIFHENAHDGKARERRGDIIICRGLPVRSRVLKLYGICDVVEFIKSENGMSLPNEKGTWQAYPVEYKRGRPKQGLEDLAQLVAQALALEEMLDFPVKQAAIYYGQTRHRMEIEITNELIDFVKKIAREMHSYFLRKHTPRARVSSKCRSCSLNSICWREKEHRKSVKDYFDEAMK